MNNDTDLVRQNLISDPDLLKLIKGIKYEGNWLLAFLKQILKINKMNNIYSEISSKPGLEFVNSIIQKLDIKYSVNQNFRNLIPVNGPFIIISNHPFGGIDGLLLLKLICEIRPTFMIQGNFLLQKIEPLREMILPVNPFEYFKAASSSFRGIKDAYKHLEEGNPIGIFPAGEVSSYQLKDFKVTDRQWQKSSIKFIKNAGVPVIPVYFHGNNSLIFHILGKIHPLLRTARLPSELFNKRNSKIEICFRPLITPKLISNFTGISGLTHYLRAKTYFSGKSFEIEPFFKNIFKKQSKVLQKIADPVALELIESEIKKINCEYFLFSHGNLSAYCTPFQCIPNVMQEIGRIREITFRSTGEGTGRNLDLDQYDIHYHHLIIWDTVKKQVMGSYRLGKGKDIMNQYGRKGFYISTLFRLKKELNPILDVTIELGRSFIVQEYQRQTLSLALLWKGIYIFLLRNPEYRYLIGPVSISNDFTNQSKSLLVHFIKRNYFNPELALYVKPRKKFNTSRTLRLSNEIILTDINNDLKIIDLFIKDFQSGLSIPVLLKKYLQMNGSVLGFNIDPDFNNCLDTLMLVDITKIPSDMIENLAKGINNNRVKELAETDFRINIRSPDLVSQK